MIDYANNEIIVDGCYSCAFSRHEFSLPCGLVFENENLTIAQDWELPIIGFMIVCPKRHMEYFSELSYEEVSELYCYVHKTITYLKQLNVCDEFDIIVSEKKSSHLHIWISPKHKWIKDMFKNPTHHISEIFKYAKENLKTEENLKNIAEINEKLRNLMN